MLLKVVGDFAEQLGPGAEGERIITQADVAAELIREARAEWNFTLSFFPWKRWFWLLLLNHYDIHVFDFFSCGSKQQNVVYLFLAALRDDHPSVAQTVFETVSYYVQFSNNSTQICNKLRKNMYTHFYVLFIRPKYIIK